MERVRVANFTNTGKINKKNTIEGALLSVEEANLNISFEGRQRRFSITFPFFCRHFKGFFKCGEVCLVDNLHDPGLPFFLSVFNA